MNKKKGVSEIVSTVLIVMIAIAAVGIIAAVIIPTVRDSLTGGQACFKAVSDISIDSETTCINKTDDAANRNSTIFLGIQKGSDVSVNLVKIQILLYDKQGNKVAREISASGLSLNELKVYNISYNSSIVGDDYVAVQIAPILKVGNKEKTCDAPESKITLADCK